MMMSSYVEVQALYVEGDGLLDAGNWAAAAALFTKALAINANFRQRYISLYAKRAYAFHSLGKLEEAIADYTSALCLDPPEPDVNRAQYFFQRGMCMLDLLKNSGKRSDESSGRTMVEKAEADMTASIALFGGHPGPFHLRGMMRLDYLSDDKGACLDFTAAIDLLQQQHSKKSAAGLIAQRGAALLRLQRVEDAKRDLLDALKIAPSDFINFQLARVSAAEKNIDALISYAKDCLGGGGGSGHLTTFAQSAEFEHARSTSAEFRDVLSKGAGTWLCDCCEPSFRGTYAQVVKHEEGE